MNLQMKDPKTGAVPELRQWYFFREALIEKYGEVDEYQIAVDHETGKCYYDGKEYPIIFPRRILNFVKDEDKAIKCSFIGTHTPNRNWLMEYMNPPEVYIRWTNKGRLIGKDEIDQEYMDILCKSRYAFCPEGDYLWTYRLYESCLCRALPVMRIGNTSLFGINIYSIYENKLDDTELIRRVDENFQKVLNENLLPL
jgi:hypothetical protein